MVNGVEVKRVEAAGAVIVGGIDYIVKIVADALGKEYTAINSTPEVEKYVNKTVHAELAEFDEVFTYDIMAYVPAGATKVELYDELKEQLVLVSTEDEIAASVVAKAENDHKVSGSVADKDGEPVTATAKVDGQKLTVTVDNIAEDKQNLEGMWVQATLKAKISDEWYAQIAKKLAGAEDALSDEELNWVEVTDDGPVQGYEDDHTGVVNKAKYKVFVGNESSSEHWTNDVTVEPKTTKVKVSKVWLLDDTEEQPWPTGATVEVILRATGEGADKTGVDRLKATLDENNKWVVFDNLPKVSTVQYSVEEGEVVNGEAYTLGQVELDDTGVFKITNKRYTPEIEKYVNVKNENLSDTERDETVHVDLSAFDEVYTYDIQAFITPDAKNVEVIDELRKVLEFADATPENVKVFIKEGNAKNPPLLTAEGTELGAESYTIDEEAWKANKLVLTMGSTDKDAKVLAEAGKWLQITFDAKIKSEYKTIEALKAEGVKVWTTIVENSPIDNPDVATVDKPFSGSTGASHDGIVNDSNYNINKIEAVAGVYVDNTFQYSDRSNTVTVQPKSTEVSFTKTDLYGDELEGAKIKLTDANGNVIDEWTSTKEAHVLHLPDGEYVMTEVVAPKGYYCVTTKMRFEIKDRKIKLLTAEVNNGGNLVLEGSNIILQDCPIVQEEYEPKKDVTKGKSTTTTTTTSKVKGANTGDNNLIVIWMMTLMLSICAIAIAIIKRRRDER
jgi:hypothetical protein